ncbi:MAG: hypothetical protein FWB99_07380 [Treponema sp.]|nr:hypothetical protein [Treponema sp.]
MRQKKHLAALACLFFGLSGAFACPGCMAWDDAAWCADENPAPVRWYVDRNADATFAFSDDNRVTVSNAFWDGGGQVFSKLGTYRIEYKYGVPFIRFYWDAHNSSRAIGERFLMLRNEDFMVLYRDNTEPAFVAFRRWEGQGLLSPLQAVTASATLTEGHLHYAASPARLGTHINRVWAVEGGVGEHLHIERFGWQRELALSIGYVHFSRPYLFKANARPKRLRISYSGDISRFMEVELADTPQYQVISLEPLGFASWGWRIAESIIIEILEIRPGFRYNHLCINSVMWIVDNRP